MTNETKDQVTTQVISPSTPPEIELVRKVLRQVIDPEVGGNIVDLGLVYRIDATPDQTRIELTMTSPACPMGEMIMDDVRAALVAGLPGCGAPEILLVWEPPWDPSMMSKSAKQNLGWAAE